jgi:ComF family protein
MPWARIHPPSTLGTTWRIGQCEVCQAWCSGGVCSACQGRYAAPQTRCCQCAIRTTLGQLRCLDCQRQPPAFTTAHCVADYEFPWDRLLRRLKYGADPAMAKVLAPLMHQSHQRNPPPDMTTRFVPIPLSVNRLRERRYNQSLELCRGLSTLSQQPVLADVLWRVMESDHAQATLTREERLQALGGAFMCNPHQKRLMEGQHITLVDDVLTTGATAAHAAQVLLRGGAARVDVLVFARTPKPDSNE